MILIFCYPHVLHKEIVRLEEENICIFIHSKEEKKNIQNKKKSQIFSTTFKFCDLC